MSSRWKQDCIDAVQNSTVDYLLPRRVTHVPHCNLDNMYELRLRLHTTHLSGQSNHIPDVVQIKEDIVNVLRRPWRVSHFTLMEYVDGTFTIEKGGSKDSYVPIRSAQSQQPITSQDFCHYLDTVADPQMEKHAAALLPAEFINRYPTWTHEGVEYSTNFFSDYYQSESLTDDGPVNYPNPNMCLYTRVSARTVGYHVAEDRLVITPCFQNMFTAQEVARYGLQRRGNAWVAQLSACRVWDDDALSRMAAFHYHISRSWDYGYNLAELPPMSGFDRFDFEFEMHHSVAGLTGMHHVTTFDVKVDMAVNASTMHVGQLDMNHHNSKPWLMTHCKQFRDVDLPVSVPSVGILKQGVDTVNTIQTNLNAACVEAHTVGGDLMLKSYAECTDDIRKACNYIRARDLHMRADGYKLTIQVIPRVRGFMQATLEGHVITQETYDDWKNQLDAVNWEEIKADLVIQGAWKDDMKESDTILYHEAETERSAAQSARIRKSTEDPLDIHQGLLIVMYVMAGLFMAALIAFAVIMSRG